MLEQAYWIRLMMRKLLKWNILNYLLRPGIIPNRPKNTCPHDLIGEHGISYLFGIIQEGAILDLHNSSHDTQPHLIIFYYCYSENESKVKEKLD